jgi:hypothetical protein
MIVPSQKVVLRVRSRKETYLGKCHFLTTSKKRIGIVQQRLDLFLNGFDQFVGLGLLFFFAGCANDTIHMRIDLAEVCINEEIYPVAEQRRSGRAVACGQEVGSVGVCKKLGDKAGFENDLVEGAVGIAHCGDEAPLFGSCELWVGMVGNMEKPYRVDPKVPFLARVV